MTRKKGRNTLGEAIAERNQKRSHKATNTQKTLPLLTSCVTSGVNSKQTSDDLYDSYGYSSGVQTSYKYGSYWDKPTKGPAYVACHTSHPALPMGKGKISGGACRTPNGDFDVYVALDQYSAPAHEAGYPWSGKHAFTYAITDMSVPSKPETFLQLIAWLKEQLLAGKNVHVGCIGGHGRTGMVLAALAKEINGEEDAITWVREHYCKSAVETSTQVKFLGEHFGIKAVGGSKVHVASTGGESGKKGEYRNIKCDRGIFTGKQGEQV